MFPLAKFVKWRQTANFLLVLSRRLSFPPQMILTASLNPFKVSFLTSVVFTYPSVLIHSPRRGGFCFTLPDRTSGKAPQCTEIYIPDTVRCHRGNAVQPVLLRCYTTSQRPDSGAEIRRKILVPFGIIGQNDNMRCSHVSLLLSATKNALRFLLERFDQVGDYLFSQAVSS